MTEAGAGTRGQTIDTMRREDKSTLTQERTGSRAARAPTFPKTTRKARPRIYLLATQQPHDMPYPYPRGTDAFQAPPRDAVVHPSRPPGSNQATPTRDNNQG